MRKFLAAESFVSMATNSYQKNTVDGGDGGKFQVEHSEKEGEG